MDNHFVPNLTFGPPVVKALRKVSKKLVFDAHLMVSDPLSLVDDFAAAGVQIITVHQEACDAELPKVLKTIKAARIRTGVSVNPKTPVSAIERVLALCDLVLVMTVEPGFGGQSLIPSCLTKIHQLKKLKEKGKHRFAIEVDGGINAKTAELAVAAGAQVLVAGSAVFEGGNVSANVTELRNCVKQAIAG
jgi:ribulose-phosphate 3-epimerase